MTTIDAFGNAAFVVRAGPDTLANGGDDDGAPDLIWAVERCFLPRARQRMTVLVIVAINANRTTLLATKAMSLCATLL